MNTRQDLIRELLRSGQLKTPAIIKAFEKVDRTDFVPDEFNDKAYENFPLSIGQGQTISQPATVAFMLEKLQPAAGQKILDIGSGSGWQSAILAEIVGPAGQVIGLEIKDELAKLGLKNLGRYNFSNLRMLKGNGRPGLKNEAPFDRIIVAAAAEAIPGPLKEQLKVGGRLVMPVGRSWQDVMVVDKIGQNNFTEKYFPGFMFVPLISEN